MVFSGIPCSHTINLSPSEGWGKEEGEKGSVWWDTIFNSLRVFRNKSSSPAKQWSDKERGTLLLRLQFPLLQCRGTFQCFQYIMSLNYTIWGYRTTPVCDRNVLENFQVPSIWYKHYLVRCNGTKDAVVWPWRLKFGVKGWPKNLNFHCLCSFHLCQFKQTPRRLLQSEIWNDNNSPDDVESQRMTEELIVIVFWEVL